MKRNTATARGTPDPKPVVLRLLSNEGGGAAYKLEHQRRQQEKTLTAAVNKHRPWSEAEWNFWLDHRTFMSRAEIAAELGRTYHGLHNEIAKRNRAERQEEKLEGRLNLADVIERSHLSLRTLAARLGIGLTTLHRIASLGQWPAPARLDGYQSVEDLRAAIVAVLDEEGLPTANLFDAAQQPRRTKMHNRKLLSYEILARFGLESDPFNLEPNGQAGVFESRGVVNLMKALKLALTNQNMVALVGDIGSGKSTAINTFIDRCSADPNLVIWRPAAAQVGKLTAYSICSYIVERHSSKRPSTDHARLYRQVAEILIELTRGGASVALVIDEAHRLPAGTLASLKNLFEIRDPQAPLSRMLAIILTGQPALERSLTAVTTLREVAERTLIMPMPSQQEAIPAYLKHRIRQVGGDPDRVFTEGALKAIAKHARTYQEAGNIAAATIEQAARKGEAGKIDQAWVEEVCSSSLTREMATLREMGRTPAPAAGLKVAE